MTRSCSGRARVSDARVESEVAWLRFVAAGKVVLAGGVHVLVRVPRGVCILTGDRSSCLRIAVEAGSRLQLSGLDSGARRVVRWVLSG